MDIFNFISDYTGTIILGLCIVSILLLIIVLILSLKQHKLNKKYKKFMSGAGAKTLEDLITTRFSEIDQLKSDTTCINTEIRLIKENLLTTYQKMGVVKYDAFKEMGGKLSFVLALLDKNNNGILLNSVHSSREGCYTYLKEIIKGESFLELSEDEKTALRQAVNSTNYLE